MATKAKESPHILKVRKKLQQHLAATDSLINADALKAMRKVIEHQLERQKAERINLKTKLFTLFDENQHPAQTESKFVARLMHHLKHPEPKKSNKHLEGRVKAMHDNEHNKKQ